MSAPKVHHYVPAAYLRRFTDDDGYLWIYDSKRKEVRRQKPEQVMRIGRYYRQAWAPEGIDPDIIEKSVAVGLEPDGLAAIERLCNSPEQITGDEAANLVAYLEFQRIRVPRQAAWGCELMRQHLLATIGPKVRADLAKNKLTVTMKDSARFDYMRAALGTIHPWMERMAWEVVEAAPGSAFITTDSPVSFVNPAFLQPAEAGIGLAGTLVLFPLSSRKLLFMTHPECKSLDPGAALPRPTEGNGGVPMSFGDVFDAQKVAKTNWHMAHLAHHLCVAENQFALAAAISI